MNMSSRNQGIMIVLFAFYFYIDWLILHHFLEFTLVFLTQLTLIALAFSTVGTTIYRWLNDCQEIQTQKDKDRLLPLFNEVSRKTTNNTVNLYIDNSAEVNAYAIGSDTIVITRGAILQLNDEQIKGMLAHELGHITNGDTFISLFLLIGNLIFLFIIALFKVTVSFFDNVSNTLKDERMKPKLISIFVGSLVTACLLIVLGVKMLLQRLDELEADKFAFKIGFRDELVDALYFLSNKEIGKKRTIFEKITASHPNIHSRIAKLELLR